MQNTIAGKFASSIRDFDIFHLRVISIIDLVLIRRVSSKIAKQTSSFQEKLMKHRWFATFCFKIFNVSVGIVIVSSMLHKYYINRSWKYHQEKIYVNLMFQKLAHSKHWWSSMFESKPSMFLQYCLDIASLAP